jgi:hypothetical protein
MKLKRNGRKMLNNMIYLILKNTSKKITASALCTLRTVQAIQCSS